MRITLMPALLIAGGLAIAASPARAQAPVPPEPSFPRALVGAVAGGALGALVGGVAGAYIGGNKCTDEANPDSCYWLAGAATGIVVGMTAGAPIGAHLLNRRQGNLTVSLLASTALGIAGALVLRNADRTALGPNRTATLNTILFVVPTLQVLSSALIERGTSR